MIRYLLTETLISITINVGISLMFVVAQFHGMPVIPTSGAGGLIRDAIPQTFAITAMSVLVPTMLTRRRGDRRLLPVPSSPRSIWPGNILLRALLLALATTVCGLGFTDAFLQHHPGGYPLSVVLYGKAAYGACVALLVTPIALLFALHDVSMKQQTDTRTQTARPRSNS